jgi:hypothetical protein
VSSYQVIFNGAPADQAFYDMIAKLEVEENADLPDAISLQLPVAAHSASSTATSSPRKSASRPGPPARPSRCGARTPAC